MWLGVLTQTRLPAGRRTTPSSGTSTRGPPPPRRGGPPGGRGGGAAERLGERVGLLLVAREAVEQEAVARVARVDPVDDHLHDQIVRDELAGLHVALGLAAEL